MLKGWIIDAQVNSSGNEMDVWMIDDYSNVELISIPWFPSIHVYAEKRFLQNLVEWVSLPEIANKFSIGRTRFVKMRLSLDEYEMQNVLEIDVLDSRKIRSLAKHVESYGEYSRFVLYSVDAHLAQRFFVEYNVAPFQYVGWNGSAFLPLEECDSWPDMKVISLDFSYVSDTGFDTINSVIKKIKITERIGFTDLEINSTEIINDGEVVDFLESFADKITTLNPDIIITNGGDFLHFSALGKLAVKEGFDLNLGRKEAALCPRTMSRVVHSYGQVIRKDSYFPLSGRLHIDLKASFIVREGGILGLFELSRHSRQSPQDISRLSPGSVISAIQMRLAMEDNVLVPWKKNRPEDTKTAWELLLADRGGLYLDSKPGVYQDVIELDFASLFPSIIATRNISPETLNCACCQTYDEFPSPEDFVPLNPELAKQTFRERSRKEMFASKLFPISSRSALRVPGLKTHTCARVQGFLGRVVAPIIERRRILKLKRKKKGDVYDLQQNALKWLLVTCFGYTGYKNARFGRIEAHEAICSWAREILLSTISAAEEEGWNVLHAIVDCIWIENPNLKTREEKLDAAKRLANKVSNQIGIPLEFEDIYDFIGFLPSRMHGAGSLTKYWAHGQNGFKLRGIEARQHSTCKWIATLQNNALNIILDAKREGVEILQLATQKKIIDLLKNQLNCLQNNTVPLEDLVITKRVSKNIDDFSVRTATQCALIRAKMLGHEILPGRKVRFVMTKMKNNDHQTRVILSEEIGFCFGIIVDYEYYKSLAERAIWAILGPFGWSDEEISQGGKKSTLFDFFNSLKRQSGMDNPTS